MPLLVTICYYHCQSPIRACLFRIDKVYLVNRDTELPNQELGVTKGDDKPKSVHF